MRFIVNKIHRFLKGRSQAGGDLLNPAIWVQPPPRHGEIAGRILLKPVSYFSAMFYKLLWDSVLNRADLGAELGKGLSSCDLLEAFPKWAQNEERVLVYQIIILKTGRGLKTLHLISSAVGIGYSCGFCISVVNYKQVFLNLGAGSSAQTLACLSLAVAVISLCSIPHKSF